MSSSADAPMIGFKAFGRKVTYEEYTSLPLTAIVLDQPMSTMAEEDFYRIDFTMDIPDKVYPLKELSIISVGELLKVKDNIEPVLNLDLFAAESAGMVPKVFPDSKPDFNDLPLYASSFDDIHESIDTMLMNIHYAFRLHALLYKMNRIRRLDNGTMKFNNERINALVHQEATTALDDQWHEVKIFANDRELGLVHWLWADVDVSHTLLEGSTPTAATGAVLFSYVPHWMAGEGVLRSLDAPVGLTDPNAPTWFGGLRAACQRTNVQHLAIYTGVHLVIATFNARFDAVAISQPLTIYCGQNVGYGLDRVTRRPRPPFSSMPICLGQVITQLMADARANASVPKSAEPELEIPVATTSSSQAPIQSLPFPLAGYITPSDVPPWPPAPVVKGPSAAQRFNSKNRHRLFPYLREPSTEKQSSPPPSVLPKRIPSAPGYDPSRLVILGSKRAFDDFDLDKNKESPLPIVIKSREEEPPAKRLKLDVCDSVIQRVKKPQKEDVAYRQYHLPEHIRAQAAVAQSVVAVNASAVRTQAAQNTTAEKVVTAEK
ncbi:hypothetical protein FRB94_001775, partial [Tulasnella sp. JGI-2019a]